jgi:hypothetical protein
MSRVYLYPSKLFFWDSPWLTSFSSSEVGPKVQNNLPFFFLPFSFHGVCKVIPFYFYPLLFHHISFLTLSLLDVDD